LAGGEKIREFEQIFGSGRQIPMAR
jgi:hypothetical protein